MRDVGKTIRNIIEKLKIAFISSIDRGSFPASLIPHNRRIEREFSTLFVIIEFK